MTAPPPAPALTAMLDELDELRAKATPGPWTAATAPSEGSDETHAEYLTRALRPDEGRPLWVAWAPAVDGLHDADYVVAIVTGDGPTSEANARFAAEAHALVPRLTAALRAALEVQAFVKDCAVGIAPRHAAIYEDIARRLDAVTTALEAS